MLLVTLFVIQEPAAMPTHLYLVVVRVGPTNAVSGTHRHREAAVEFDIVKRVPKPKQNETQDAARCSALWKNNQSHSRKSF